MDSDDSKSFMFYYILRFNACIVNQNIVLLEKCHCVQKFGEANSKKCGEAKPPQAFITRRLCPRGSRNVEANISQCQ